MKEETQLFEICLDKISLFMPVDYEKQLIISVFSVKFYLVKTTFEFFKGKNICQDRIR